MIPSFLRPLISISVLLLLVTPTLRAQDTTELRAPAAPISTLKAPTVPDTAKGVAPASPRTSDFIIGAEDVLSVNVWREPEISNQTVPVRSDGKISIALIGDVVASGRTVEELQSELLTRLKEYIASPVVTVIVREIKSRNFNILGQVSRPGMYPLDKPTTVVDAIALAGGFREWAKVKSIYVLRRRAGEAAQRIPFDYKQAILGNMNDFELQSRDTIVVP